MDCVPLTLEMRQAVFFMQSWLNWYSTGLEIRHPERVSGFESLALRYAPMAELEDALDLSSNA